MNGDRFSPSGLALIIFALHLGCFTSSATAATVFETNSGGGQYTDSSGISYQADGWLNINFSSVIDYAKVSAILVTRN